MNLGGFVNPLDFAAVLWPHVTLYDKQKEILLSLVENDRTVVPAGNELGKDFIAGMACVWFFLTRKPVRGVTTSAKDDHLRVLWGEVNRFVETSAVPLKAGKGGPLVLTHQSMRKLKDDGSLQVCPISYLIGMVASQDSIAAMQGHHANPDNLEEANDGIPRTLFVSDESSSVSDEYFRMASTWAKRMLIIGNPWPCENFFKREVKGTPGTNDRGGDLPRQFGGGLARKVIRIKAEDSPNVRLGLAQVKSGLTPTGEVILPGVKGYGKYVEQRSTLPPNEACVVLDADFYEGKEVKLFPPEWLNRAETVAEGRGLVRNRLGDSQRAMGIDPAEGGDKTVWCVVDSRGVLDLESLYTPNTAMIPDWTLAKMREWGVPAERVVFDRGGGGYEHACILKERGYGVRSVGFGESLSLDPRRGMTLVEEKLDHKAERYAYKNRRAEMYGDLSLLLDPSKNPQGFGIPREYAELRRQLSPIPRWYDEEGRLYLPPKHRKPTDNTTREVVTLVSLLGCSPDEADALVLSVHGLLHKAPRKRAGVAF